MNGYGLTFDPAFPWPAIAVIAGLALAAGCWALWRGLRGWAWRALAGLAAALALAGPALEKGERLALSDIAILIDDRTASQSLPGRSGQTDAAIAEIEGAIAALPGTELRRVTVPDDPDGSMIATAIARAVAAEPADRLAGVIVVSDGQAHDPAMLPSTLPAPLHLLMTGRPQDWDRRLVIEEAPGFGLIDQQIFLRVRIEDQGDVPADIAGRSATLRWSVDGEDEQIVAVPPGRSLELPVTLGHAGTNVVSVSIDAPQASRPELTGANNAAALQINGVRDRLRVLLVSGEPNQGERTWRNLLKSDAAVDLIHFTILRPPDKQDGVPVEELSLIAFPTHELFMERIEDFDVIIFDRYAVRGILASEYYENIRRYVEGGGAILVSAGPEMATVESLYLSPLGPILPARPTGRVQEAPVLPELTAIGQRHPVTAGLPGAPSGDGGAHWGRWLRWVEMNPLPGAEPVLTGEDGQALLILSRQGEGRVALLASDQVWLWGRGFEGGGPQLELLRRIAHWSMQEPELEEEALTADVSGLTLTVTRRTLADNAPPVTIEGPHATARLVLQKRGEGRFVADWTAPGPGLYRLTQGEMGRVVAIGPAAPREFERAVAGPDMLVPLIDASGGSVVRLSDGVPELRQVRPGRPTHGQGVGRDWIALTPREAGSVTGLSRRPILPGWAWLVLVSGLALTGWLAEGRIRSRAS